MLQQEKQGTTSPLLKVEADADISTSQVRVHTREPVSLKPLTDVQLDREGAEWPPRLSSSDRAEIMRPENLRSGMQLLSETHEGMPRRHLLVRT